MATVLDLIDNLKEINVKKISTKAIELNKGELVLLNQTQLFGGENNRGESFKKYRWPEYAKQKNEQNPKPGLGYPDLKLTGSFYRSFFAEVKGDNIIIDARDKKKEWLMEHYSTIKKGQLIFGLTPDNTEVFIEICFAPDVKKLIEEQTGLKFTT